MGIYLEDTNRCFYAFMKVSQYKKTILLGHTICFIMLFMVEDKIGYALCIDRFINNDLLCYHSLE